MSGVTSTNISSNGKGRDVVKLSPAKALKIWQPRMSSNFDILASGDFLGLVSDLQEIKGDVELRLPIILYHNTQSTGSSSPWSAHTTKVTSSERILICCMTQHGRSHTTLPAAGSASSGPNPSGREAMAVKVEHTPSNVIEYGYPVGTLNRTGDDPCLFPLDCPDFGGFVSSTTIVKADY